MATDTTIDETLAEAGLDPVSTAAREPTVDAMAIASLPMANLVAAIVCLTDEVHYWREHAACELDELMRALDRRAAPKAFLVARIHNAYLGLRDALAGEFYERCEGCGEQIRPGQIEIPCTDVRSHADCSGKEGIKAGDQVRMDPASIEVPEGEPPSDHVVAFETQPLFTAAQIQERVQRAHAVLAQAGRV